MTFEEIVEAMGNADIAKKVADHFKFKTDAEVDELTNGLVKKKTELLEEVKKLKDGKKSAEDLQKSYENIKNSIKTLNLEGVFSDNDSVDLIVLEERLKDVSKRLNSAGQSPDIPKELAEAKKEAEEAKKEILTYRKQLDKMEKEFTGKTADFEALTSEKAAADQALHQVMVNQEFKTLLVGRSMNPIQAEAISKYLIEKSGAKVFRDDSGIYKAGCEDGTTNISDWLESFALSTEGKVILPEVKPTGGSANNGGTGGSRDAKSYTVDELTQLYHTDPNLYKRVMAARKG